MFAQTCAAFARYLTMMAEASMLARGNYQQASKALRNALTMTREFGRQEHAGSAVPNSVLFS
jgi:hypothetical protein